MERRRGRGLPLALVAAALLVVTTGSSSARITAGPAVTVGPTVIGTVAAGKRLTGLSGTWAGYGRITYRFQWYRCDAAGARCRTIQGATAPSYALGGKDVGKTLGLTVRATDSTGTAAAYASLVGPVAPARPLLESTVQPVVTGPPVLGKTVQVSIGTWSPAPAQITYAWERCNPHGRVCAAIPGATGSQYTIGNDDVGHALLAIVQGTNGSTIQNTFSTATPAVVAGPVPGPVLVAGPSISGSAVQRQQLTAVPGIWRGIGPIAFAYHWYRCDATGSHCDTIQGATKGTYTLAGRDAGRTIALTLRATDSTATTTAYASLVGPVAPADSLLVPTAVPTISGTARAGGVLHALHGLWSLAHARYSYTWLRCNRNGRLCLTIRGASSASYRVTSADVGHTLAAVVHARSREIAQAALTPATAPVS